MSRSLPARGFSSLRHLSPWQVFKWRRSGYIVLRGFFDESRIDEANIELDRLWDDRRTEPNPLTIDIYSDSHARKYMKDADDGDRLHVYKLNDVYLESATVRNLALDPKLVGILKSLIDGPPMVCNSLHFERGSEQPLHFDTFYMPPPADSRLIVTSICLEDVHPDAGPVAYVAGSQKIPPYIGVRGDRSVRNGPELDAAEEYIRSSFDLEKETATFLGQKGDVLIWHEQFLHGGSPIIDRSRTRRSIVTHYFRVTDTYRPILGELNGGFWIQKEHAPVG